MLSSKSYLDDGRCWSRWNRWNIAVPALASAGSFRRLSDILWTFLDYDDAEHERDDPRDRQHRKRVTDQPLRLSSELRTRCQASASFASLMAPDRFCICRGRQPRSPSRLRASTTSMPSTNPSSAGTPTAIFTVMDVSSLLVSICEEAEEFLRDASDLNPASRRWIENALNEARPGRKKEHP